MYRNIRNLPKINCKVKLLPKKCKKKLTNSFSCSKLMVNSNQNHLMEREYDCQL